MVRRYVLTLAALTAALASRPGNSFADNLNWDTNTVTPGSQGGTGAWNVTPGNSDWWNSLTSSNQDWDNAHTAVFGNTAGTVTASTVTATGLEFDTAGYTLTGGTVTLSGAATIVANQSANLYSNISGNVGGLTTAANAILRNAPANKNKMIITGSVVNNGEIDTADSSAVYFQGAYSDSSSGTLLNEDGGLSTRGSAFLNTPANFAGRGFHFDNGLVNNVYSTITSLPYNSNLPSPMIVVGDSNDGAKAATTVNFHGTWHGEGGLNSVYNELMLEHGSKFYVSADAAMDQVLSDNQDQWARQLWVGGDASANNVLELDPNFVAVQDHSVNDPYHVNRDILGSIEMTGGVTVITHSTQSLPQYLRYLVSDSSPNNINGHMSFFYDTNGSPQWNVETQAQTYTGAIWFYVNGTIQTDTDLTSTGTNHYESQEGYYSRNGFRIYAPHDSALTYCTATKTGNGTLNLNGDQAYYTGSVLQINGGTVNFNTDPGNPTVILTDSSHLGGQTLNVKVATGAKAVFAAKNSHIASLSITDGEADVTQGTPNFLTTAGLSIIGQGKLDIRNGGLIVQGGDIGQITAWVNAGRDGGDWLGNGIISSYAAAHGGDLLVLSGSSNLSGTIFAGLPINSTDVLVEYVPEPASVGLLVTGGAMLLARRRRAPISLDMPA